MRFPQTRAAVQKVRLENRGEQGKLDYGGEE
jgi:hypothetical protein